MCITIASFYTPKIHTSTALHTDQHSRVYGRSTVCAACQSSIRVHNRADLTDAASPGHHCSAARSVHRGRLISGYLSRREGARTGRYLASRLGRSFCMNSPTDDHGRKTGQRRAGRAKMRRRACALVPSYGNLYLVLSI